MLIWCSYCRHFLGESPPFEDLGSSHGLCQQCAPKFTHLCESESGSLAAVQLIHAQLLNAGERQDFSAAMLAIEQAERANVRATDILVGVIAPILYKIGTDWENGTRSVAEEHRFTTFFEQIYDVIAARRVRRSPAKSMRATRLDALLMNAPGNAHTFGTRILALWLADNGVQAITNDAPLDAKQAVELVGGLNPRLVLISISLAEQYDGVKAIVDLLTTKPRAIRPRVIIGGYAVKAGLVSAIPGAELVTDISSISALPQLTRHNPRP